MPDSKMRHGNRPVILVKDGHFGARYSICRVKTKCSSRLSLWVFKILGKSRTEAHQFAGGFLVYVKLPNVLKLYR